MGADIYTRLLFGARLTILIAVVATTAAVLIGVPVGLVAGYYTNWVSDLLMRVSDIFLAVPQIVLAIAIAQTLGPAIQNVILALSVTYWPFWARLVYAETRSQRNEVFIEAAIALGASPLRVMVLHVLPSIASLGDRAHHDRHGRHHPGRGGARLPRSRPAAAHAGMGPHDRGKPRVPAAGLVVRRRAGRRDPAGGDGLQPAGRRAARRARSAHATAMSTRADLLSVRDLSVSFVTEGGVARVLDAVSLSLAPGEIMGLVGESGCGKTTLARAILGALPANATVDGGRAAVRRPGPAGARSRRGGRARARPRHHVCAAGSVQLVQPAVHCRRPDHRADALEVAGSSRRRARLCAQPSPARSRARAGDAAQPCSFPIRNVCCASIRTSSRAGSGNG